MMQDEFVLEQTTIEENSPETQVEDVQISVDVEEPEIVEIEVSEGFAGNTSLNVSADHSRYLPNQHTIGAITGLQENLDALGVTGTVYGAYGGFAELWQWHSDQTTRNIGYFVKLHNENNNTYIKICDAKDAYGVTVQDGGFCGYQNSTYNILDSTTLNKAADPSYAKVCLLGNVKVRVYTHTEWEQIRIGDYVVSDDFGCAIRQRDADGNVINQERAVGFKVISKGKISGEVDSWDYVGIALVPQNDAASRVLVELESAKVQLGDIIVQVGDMSEKVDDVEGIVGDLGDAFDDLQANVDKELEITKDIAETAKDASRQAYDTMNKVSVDVTNALSTAQDAKNQVADAVSQIGSIQESIKPLAEYNENGKTGVVGFVAQATEDHTKLASLAQAFGDNGSDVTSIIQKIDENGAAIQHLVTHVDLYSIGGYSPTYNYSYAETAIMQPGHIYVPTVDVGFVNNEISYIYEYTLPVNVNKDTACYFTVDSKTYWFTTSEDLSANTILKYNNNKQQLTINNGIIIIEALQNEFDSTSMIELSFVPEYEFAFSRNSDGRVQSYVWQIDREGEADKYIWAPDAVVITDAALATNPANKSSFVDGDLWWAYDGVLDGDRFIYEPDSLYRWDGNKKVWVIVARENDNTYSRVVSLVQQTANELTSSYTNLRGDISVIKQDVDHIETLVKNVDSMSTINQTAKDILLGVYDVNGASSSLELLLGGMQSVSQNAEHVCVEKISQSAPDPIGDKYTQPPVWNGSEFVFSEAAKDNVNGTYYFHTNKTTNYCKIVDDGYEVYGIGNMAIASLKSRATATETELESWTKFRAGANETMTYIGQTSDADGAEISSMVFGDYRKCSDISRELTEEEVEAFNNVYRYANQPNWISTEFSFNGVQDDINGLYCMLDDMSCYYKLLLNDNSEIIGYEKYEMQTSNYAAIVQKVDEDGSSIGLAAGNDDNIGSLFVEAINDRSTVTINADRIKIQGTTTFEDILNPGTTTISGSYIRSGLIESNNYSKDTESIFADAGTRLDLTTGSISTRNLALDDNGNLSINTNGLKLTADGNLSITGKITATSGYIAGFTINHYGDWYYNGELEPGYPYYFVMDGVNYYFIAPSNDLLTFTNAPEYILTCGDRLVEYDNRESAPADATFITLTRGYSYIGYGQDSLNPSIGKGSAGVYVSPEGIGLGNGNFVVDNKGNITMSGNIVLDGVITWGTGSNPVQVKYSSSGTGTPETNPSSWHDTYNSTYDYYASYSYDGGVTWTDAIKIRGEDGKDGSNGSSGRPGKDANLSEWGIFDTSKSWVASDIIYSPLLAGTFAVANKSTGDLTGYMGFATGGTQYWDDDGEKQTTETHGVAIHSGDTDEVIDASTSIPYVIVTDYGARMSCGNNAVYVTKSGAYVVQNGTHQLIGGGGSTPILKITFG